MIDIKSEKEIKIMQEGGEILASALFEVLRNVKAGISELKLDGMAEKLILARGAEPGFKKVEGYKHTICISVNDVVVHGVPTNYKLKEGDKVGIDCGVFYRGFHTDMAQTARVRAKNEERKAKGEKDEVDKFLETGERAMWTGIKAAKSGQRVGDISKAIQEIVEAQGYSMVRSLVGHGVGRKLHEDPEVPGFLDGPIVATPLLKEGMTIAIEVIYNMGKSDVIYSNHDGWTIKTKDGSLSGLFERSIAITKNDAVILTK